MEVKYVVYHAEPMVALFSAYTLREVIEWLQKNTVWENDWIIKREVTMIRRTVVA